MKPIDVAQPMKVQEVILSDEFNQERGVVQAVLKTCEPGYSGYLFSTAPIDNCIKLTAFYNVERAEVIVTCEENKILHEALRFIKLNGHADFHDYRAGYNADDFIKNKYTVVLIFTFAKHLFG